MKAKSAPQGSQRLGIVAVAAVLALAIGVAAGVLIPRVPPPASIAGPEAVTNVTTSAEEFLDARQVEIVVTQRGNRGLAAPMGGVVTGAACAAGSPISSGSSSFSINGVTQLNFATAFPLWRSLAPGDEGVDVATVQTELKRLGYDIDADGVMGTGTLNAFNALVSAATGARQWSDRIDPSIIVWLPTATVTPTSCPINVGDQVNLGQQLAILPPVLSSVGLKALPADLVTGERAIVLDGVAVPVDARGDVVDIVAAQALTATDSYRRFAADPKGTVLAGELQLASPINVVRIPPSAIFGVDTTTSRACVSAGGRAIQGQLVGSELGYTLMTFPDPKLVATVDLRPKSGITCP